MNASSSFLLEQSRKLKNTPHELGVNPLYAAMSKKTYLPNHTVVIGLQVKVLAHSIFIVFLSYIN
jgi:hypothetical protein